ncbi:MAG: hypothetical protein M3083_18585 [Actinomycetota bacterium]|nr:hypothetical protein [Actinomycetota bacterium]
MRDRRRADWVTDLDGRHTVERQVRTAIESHPQLRVTRDSTASFDRLDFALAGPGGRPIELEVKAKNQPLSAGWRVLRPDVDPGDLFVLDELAMRKMVDAGRHAFMIVRDVPRDCWFLWSAGDLAVATRVRHSRRLQKGTTAMVKGKLLLNLAEAGYRAPALAEVVDTLATTAGDVDRRWRDISPWPAGTVSTMAAGAGR